MSNRTMLPGVALCKPYEQGDFDNLCGLYASLNAIQLVTAPARPISRVDANQLFLSGIDYLNRRKALVDVLEHGMDYRRQHALTRHMAKSASRITGISVTVEQAYPLGKPRDGTQTQTPIQSTDQIMSGIAHRLSLGTAVIIELRKTLYHYTVIVGISPSRVILFDSDGLHWIERRSFGICDRGSQLRHCISLASLIEVSVVST